MKLYRYCLIIISLFLLLTACDKDTEGVSRVTYYVDFELKEGGTLSIPVGATFTDPGVIAMEGENDVTSTVEVSGSVNTGEVGLYILTYKAVNADGFDSSISRNVFVYNPDVTSDISGVYAGVEGTHRLAIASGTTVDYPGYNVTLTQLAPGIYQVNDFFVGYYAVRAGYGSGYAMTGYMKMNPDNTLEVLSSRVAGWGDSLDDLVEGEYNPETGVVKWGAEYAGAYIFYVVLTK